jgi:putative transposase
VVDALFDGRRLRTLTIVDNDTRECLAIEVGAPLRGENVVVALDRIAVGWPLPRFIKADNGNAFVSKVLDTWAYERGVEIDFSRPSKPTDNAKNESFNGRLHEECPNAHGFLSLEVARRKIEAWRQDYNAA